MRKLLILALVATACSGGGPTGAPLPSADLPTPQIVYITPAPPQDPTPTPEATPEPTPTPTPRMTRPPTPEPTPIDTSYLDFLIEFEAFREDVLAAAASMEEGDMAAIGIGVRLAERSTADALAWLRDNPSQPCYAESYDLFQQAVETLDYAFAQMSDAWDIFDADGIEEAGVTMQEGMALFVESGENPDDC